MCAGNARIIIKTKPEDSSYVYKLPESVFTRTILLSPNSVIVRMFEGLDPVFGKRNLTTGELVKSDKVFGGKADAGFSTDGELLYDKRSNLLIYTHYYNNEIIILDTNMNIVKKSKTLGKNNISVPKTGKIASKNVITNSTPERLYNASSCVSNGYLFIHSRLKADNETDEQFKHNSAIDVYNIKTGMPEKSFYIPEYKGKKIYGFSVIGNSIFALYRNYIVSYRLPFEI